MNHIYDFLTIILVAWVIIGLFGGYAIGRLKGRAVAGSILGALVGPLGWLLVAVGPVAGSKCPICGGPLPGKQLPGDHLPEKS